MVSNDFYMGQLQAFIGGSPLGATSAAPTDIVDGGYVAAAAE